MWVLGNFVMFAALLGCHASDLSQDEGWVVVANKLEAMEAMVHDLKNENEAMKMEFERLRNSTLAAVTTCFSALQTSSQSVVSGDTILFGEELVDTDDAFNTSSGLYTIPQTGIWEVIVTLYKPMNSGAVYNDNLARLYVDDTFLTRVRHYTTDSGDSAHTTATIIREFRTGEILRVQSDSTGTFFGSTAAKASQFSAKLLGQHP